MTLVINIEIHARRSNPSACPSAWPDRYAALAVDCLQAILWRRIDIFMTGIIFKSNDDYHHDYEAPTKERIAKSAVLVTGASSGIGATYADRFARRGHDLVLVARDKTRLEALASRLRSETGVAIDVIQADLTVPSELATVEARLRDDNHIGILVNNAGAALSGPFDQQDIGAVDSLVTLNTTALVRLAHVASVRFVKAGEGSIINLASVVGLAPEFGQSVYGATKAFVTFLSQGLNLELGPKGVYVQAVLPAATGTEIWTRSGADPSTLPPLMEVGELVDAALVGFDLREAVTIPPLHDGALWDAYQTARQTMLPGFGQVHAAARYRKPN